MTAFSADWSKAPRDGSIVEIESNAGIRPWYDLYRWDGSAWASATIPSTFISSEARAGWRPFTGDPAHYIDPTNGFQFDGAYWGGPPGDIRA